MTQTGKDSDKKARVEQMFDSIAPSYDALNHLLSAGVDIGWRRRVVKMVRTFDENEDGLRLLDVATGTGDLAIALARAIPAARVTGVDISEGMLEIGREKVAGRGLAGRVELRTGDAEALEFEGGRFDAVTVAFGVRNFGDMAAGLAEMARVLRPGGRCWVLEFSEPRVPVLGALYRFYFRRVLPLVGRIVSRDRGAYTYLPRSVGEFPAPEQFSEMLRRAGFTAVHRRRLSLGIAWIYEAVR
ncbi:MAG: bifunctional demethylmenaquinone methyltransferase/2-methoxy-6-polyprenyl-1,4-benzoquinol methylase UbiE [Alistipes sp.]|jgi:demethylmenaquinone methyltransferase/2-methoxy-6-polyprenyl-1,4-benzoquinol methylase|nr:bifunctional demethylmenaquinone methyltransferase/2-methoxy-6-polyprenyl-1,4-benzoquinol methylase UbiE [Alistipes sp.]